MPGEVADPGFFEWAFKGVVAILVAIGGFMWTLNWNRTSKVSDGLDALEENHTNNILYAERTFAKAAVVNDSFDRLTITIGTLQGNMQNMSITQATLATNMANMATNLQHITQVIKDK